MSIIIGILALIVCMIFLWFAVIRIMNHKEYPIYEILVAMFLLETGFAILGYSR